MHAVGEDRARRQGVERHQPLERAGIAAPARVLDVGAVLGDMDMRHGPERARQRARLPDRLVRHGEARVQSDEAAHERRGGSIPAGIEPAPRLLAPEIALARAIAEERPDAEVAASPGQNGQGILDQVRQFVMVDERRHAGEKRPGDIIARRRLEALRVERAVEAPPHPFQNLDESSAAAARAAAGRSGRGRCRDGCGRRRRPAPSRRRRRQDAPRPGAASATTRPPSIATLKP